MPERHRGRARERRLGRHAHRARRRGAGARPRPPARRPATSPSTRTPRSTKAWRVLGFDPAHLRVLERRPGHRLDRRRRRGARSHSTATAGLASVRRRRHRRHDEHRRRRPAGRTRRPRAARGPVAARRRRLRRARPPHPARQGAADRHRARRLLVLDPHKWLFQPYEIGCVLIREPGPAAARVHARRRLPARHRRRRRRVPRARPAAHPRLARAEALALADASSGSTRSRTRSHAGIALAEHAERRPARTRRLGGRLARLASRSSASAARAHDDAQTDALVRAAVADGYAAPSTTILGGRTVAAALHDQSAHHRGGHRAHDRAPGAPRPLRHLHTRRIPLDMSDLNRFAAGSHA